MATGVDRQYVEDHALRPYALHWRCVAGWSDLTTLYYSPWRDSNFWSYKATLVHRIWNFSHRRQVVARNYSFDIPLLSICCWLQRYNQFLWVSEFMYPWSWKLLFSFGGTICFPPVEFNHSFIAFITEIADCNFPVRLEKMMMKRGDKYGFI